LLTSSVSSAAASGSAGTNVLTAQAPPTGLGTPAALAATRTAAALASSPYAVPDGVVSSGLAAVGGTRLPANLVLTELPTKQAVALGAGLTELDGLLVDVLGRARLALPLRG
jgi:hypothetical protein